MTKQQTVQCIFVPLLEHIKSIAQYSLMTCIQCSLMETD